jgi:hypothetical protein
VNFQDLVTLCRDTHLRLTMAASRVTQPISATLSRISHGTYEPDLPSLESCAVLHQNMMRIRQFYFASPKRATASHLLSWSHWVEILKIKARLERITINLEETRRDS